MTFKKIAMIVVAVALSVVWYPAQSKESEASTGTQNKRSILILATNHISNAKLKLFSDIAAKNDHFTVDYKYLRAIKEGDSISELIAPFDLVIFDSISAKEASEEYARFETAVANNQTAIFVPIKVTTETKLKKGVSSVQIKSLYDYYYNGGEKNLLNMQLFLASELFDLTDDNPAAAIIFPNNGIYHPEYEKTVFSGFADYLKWKKANTDNNLIGIAMSRESIAADSTRVIDALITAIEDQDAIAVPFYYSGMAENEYIDLLSINGKVAVDIIINTRIIHWAEKRRKEYEAPGVSVMQVLPYMKGGQAQWEADQAGIPAEMNPFFLSQAHVLNQKSKK